MIGDETKKNQVITLRARAKLCRARAGDLQPLPPIVAMAFGDGGTDEDGEPIPPATEQTDLTHRLLTKNIESHSYPSSTTCKYKCTLDPDELPNAFIDEIGLVDADGDIVAIRTFLKKGHDEGLEMTFTVDDIL